MAREPLPPPSELYERAIRAAVAIAEDATESTNGRVGALRLILEAVGKAGAPPESGKLSDAQVNARLAELRSQLLAGGEAANGEAKDDDGKSKEPKR